MLMYSGDFKKGVTEDKNAHLWDLAYSRQDEAEWYDCLVSFTTKCHQHLGSSAAFTASPHPHHHDEMLQVMTTASDADPSLRCSTVLE